MIAIEAVFMNQKVLISIISAVEAMIHDMHGPKPFHI